MDQQPTFPSLEELTLPRTALFSLALAGSSPKLCVQALFFLFLRKLWWLLFIFIF